MRKAHFGGTHCECPSQTECSTTWYDSLQYRTNSKKRECGAYRGSLIGSRHWATAVQFRASARAEKVKGRRVGTLGC